MGEHLEIWETTPYRWIKQVICDYICNIYGLSTYNVHTHVRDRPSSFDLILGRAVGMEVVSTTRSGHGMRSLPGLKALYLEWKYPQTEESLS